ncbi:hypothetical protein FSARC_11329 [Fusarium sarcochroum]|uniref:Helicase ATP-binding domain-containing protein n=1 Tax=Fusarium sarcochroum TaxID=1208366 RepID=A0A8H4TGB5_9HYPO|nr:hypothetical protein FSARC_11329 [Fusarium sarcochroum]
MDLYLLLNPDCADLPVISADRPLPKPFSVRPTNRPTTTSTTPCGDPSQTSSPRLSSEVGGEQDTSASPPSQTYPTGLNSSPRDIICFGMLNLPIIKILPGPQPFESVKVRQGGEIFSVISNGLRGSVRSRHAQLLELFRTEHMELDLRISSVGLSVNTCSVQCALQAILYGDRDLCDGLKEVLRSQNLFLQDPYGASRDVVYWNPQRYCNSPERRTSHFSSANEDQKAIEERISHVDLLSGFTSGSDLSETEPSSFVRTPLKPHQKQALSFMINRERGWNLETRGADLWSYKQNARLTTQEFVNNVSGASQYESPPDFRGGILADSMGSGKTLSMIALIAHDRVLVANRPGIVNTNTTLVIVPPSLLDNWRNELSRIVLDEAHYIKNPSRATTKAVGNIQSARRWAVTGTPIQNSPSDLQSILCFIGAHPYSDKAAFDNDINRKLMSGEEEEAVNRLKHLLSFLMLRRSNSIVLPVRSDFVQTVEFDAQELSAYRQAAEMTLSCIDTVLQPGHAKNGYINALQKINTLRRICNLGHLSYGVDSELPKDADYSGEAPWDQITAQKALDQFFTLGLSLNCVGCQQPMDNTTREHIEIFRPRYEL